MTDRLTKTIDDQIREALRRDDAELLDHYRGDLPIHEQLIETFQGRNRWLSGVAFLFTLAAFGLVCVAAYQFFRVETTRAMIAWAAVFLWGALSVAMLKIWFWLEMHRNNVTREIKRLELQIAGLSRQLASTK
jgi:uncharacterized membrane protein YciS (DUF1049 family)